MGHEAVGLPRITATNHREHRGTETGETFLPSPWRVLACWNIAVTPSPATIAAVGRCCSGAEGKDPPNQRTAAVAQLAQAAHGLHPPERLFDQICVCVELDDK
jgi:hypothetical protein